MKFSIVVFFLLIALTIQAQAQTSVTVESPDMNTTLVITSREMVDQNTEWKYWIVRSNNDTTLLTTAVAHDEFRPVCYWTKSSQELIYEERSDPSKIKIYDVTKGKVQFETIGFIWGSGDDNFDSEQGLLFYFKQLDDKREYAVMVLDVAKHETKKLTSVVTSGDSITGVPQLQSIDLDERQLIVNFENDDWRTEKRKVDY